MDLPRAASKCKTLFTAIFHFPNLLISLSQAYFCVIHFIMYHLPTFYCFVWGTPNSDSALLEWVQIKSKPSANTFLPWWFQRWTLKDTSCHISQEVIFLPLSCKMTSVFKEPSFSGPVHGFLMRSLKAATGKYGYISKTILWSSWGLFALNISVIQYSAMKHNLKMQRIKISFHKILQNSE